MKKSGTVIWILRAFLLLLILANMAVIYGFSSENSEASAQKSNKISEYIAEKAVKDYSQKTVTEQKKIVREIDTPLRKIAHMAEFGSLGALTLLFLMTFGKNSWKTMLWKLPGSLLFTAVYAATDEYHQRFSEGRGPRTTDILVDLSGTAITCAVILLLWILHRHCRKKELSTPRVTTYRLDGKHPDGIGKIALISDFHGAEYAPILALLREECPDLILLPGDLTNDEGLNDPFDPCYTFLRDCAAIAPTFYSLGNHEIRCYHKGDPFAKPLPVMPSDEIRQRIRATGVIFLDNETYARDGLTVCGLTSGINGKANRPDVDVIDRFAKEAGFKILLCHHPEYYAPYIKGKEIDLTVCGHAHGGQWRLFGHGVFAPGQGIFPKYTSGVHDGRCVISRGLGNQAPFPRIFNHAEVVMIRYE